MSSQSHARPTISRGRPERSRSTASPRGCVALLNHFSNHARRLNSAPQMRRLSTSLLIAVVITAQLSCTRGPSTQPRPTASPTPTEQALVDQILQRYEQALGGREAIAAVTSQRMKGTFQLRNIAGNIEGWSKDPNKTLVVIEFPRIGTLK